MQGSTNLRKIWRLTLKASARMLGLLSDEMGEWADFSQVDLSELASAMSSARIEALASKDFSEVDRLKAALVQAGIEVRMSKEGVELIPGPQI